MSNKGKSVSVHYVGTLDNGEKFDSSYDRGEPIEFVCGSGAVVSGFDNAVENMEIGEKKSVRLTPDEAYGEAREDLIQEIPLDMLPNSENLPEGGTILLQTPEGQPFPAEIVKKTDKTIVFDMNHPMAGKTLNFELELVDVNPMD